jgi:hypothetical protein
VHSVCKRLAGVPFEWAHCQAALQLHEAAGAFAASCGSESPWLGAVDAVGRVTREMTAAAERLAVSTMLQVCRREIESLRKDEDWRRGEDVRRDVDGRVIAAGFGRNPSDGVTRMGDHLLTLPQQLPDYVWLRRILKAFRDEYLSLRDDVRVSAGGWSDQGRLQWDTNSEYLDNLIAVMAQEEDMDALCVGENPIPRDDADGGGEE